jgi:hypothetical protein
LAPSTQLLPTDTVRPEKIIIHFSALPGFDSKCGTWHTACKEAGEPACEAEHDIEDRDRCLAVFASF